ncbi:hypothetical protein FD723_32765 (plasmid) [Nostoc sp. C052]|uniref:hypothetical protein n=1 Tax=Nostoc sp. C052 TaxID=2576902 RepID=UPI0015C3C392|nr:hypothetical protein [Nostoc sp. C052]QLE45116.1 hypothetical protein FD723_32765 [Nostoc sp. C052]
MHKTKSSKTDSSTYSKSLALNSHPQLAHRYYGSEIQKASVVAKTQTDIENESFAEQQMEATGLSIQAKSGSITPEGQERLTVLQAKMDGLLNYRLSHARRFGHNIANIPLRKLDTPIQPKLTIREAGDQYEQEADETARQVVQKIHQPQSEKLQRESLSEEEDELQMKPERSIQRDSLPAEDEEIQMKPMVRQNDTIVQRMPRNKDKAVSQLNPSEIQQIYSKFAASKRQKKLEEIVWEGHLEAISDVCEKNKYTIAIRETGPLSIRRIAEGAKAKPHTILEKSIKESSVKKGYNNQAQEVLTKLEQWDLDGFVGHWNANNELIGLRIDNIPPKVERQVYIQKDNGIPYVPLNVNLPGGGLAILRLKRVTGWKQYLYTGDYDLHEIYSAGAGGGQIAEATPEKVRLLDRLNKGIQSQGRNSAMRSGKAELQGDPKRVHVEGEYAMFQHGDQATYRMNQHLEAQEMESNVAQLVQAVATESDEPIAWCRMGKWFVTLDKYEHDVFRIMHGIKKPHTWNNSEDQRTKTGKHTEQYL